MQPQNSNAGINLDLIDQVVERIPEWTWHVVKNQLVTNLVDAMPTTVLERLTGSATDDDRAQEILDDYYASSSMNKDLLVDSFKIIGEEQTLYSLDSLQLDKITKPTSQEDYNRD
jgi:BioD-like phosphotransacetylase family protein